MSGSAPIARPGTRHVFVHDMVLLAPIGVHAYEHEAPQRIRVNVDMAVPDGGDGADRLARTADYARVVETVRRVAWAGHTRLVETLAERIAAAVLEDRGVTSVRVRVEKLDVFADVGAVGVEIHRDGMRPGAADSVHRPA